MAGVLCQSCGMAVVDGFFGTRKNGTLSPDYCKLCFNEGQFTEPHLTSDAMVCVVTEQMMRDLDYPLEKAEAASKALIPSLKRWKKSSRK